MRIIDVAFSEKLVASMPSRVYAATMHLSARRVSMPRRVAPAIPGGIVSADGTSMVISQSPELSAESEPAVSLSTLQSVTSGKSEAARLENSFLMSILSIGVLSGDSSRGAGVSHSRRVSAAERACMLLMMAREDSENVMMSMVFF